MSATRRILGTGPTTTDPVAGDEQPRLLPAERVDPGALPDRIGDEQRTATSGRRILGTGPRRAVDRQ